MKRKHILPINAEPIILSMPFLAIQCGVFQAHDINHWLLNKFINIASNYDARVRYQHLHNDEWFEQEKVTDKHHMTLLLDMLELKSYSVMETIKEMVSNGYYLSGNSNVYYLKESHACRNLSYCPPYLIYGYDEDRELFFYAVGSTKNSRYEPYTIAFPEYIESIKNNHGLFHFKPNFVKLKSVTDSRFNLNFIRLNSGYNFKTNYSEIYNGIYDYLNSSNKSDGAVQSASSLDRIYGLDCYRDFLHYITFTYDFHEYIEPFHYLVFLEHHQIMENRLKYLHEIGVVKNSQLCGDYSKIREKSEIVYENCKKYNTTHEFRLLGEIYTDVEEIIEEETAVLKDFLAELGVHIETVYK